VTRSVDGLVVDDPLFGRQWGFAQIHAPQAWAATMGSASVRVAVLDTGVDLEHPDLAPNLAAGYDYVDHDPFPYDESEDGHGTHIAGVIGAVADNGVGVAGLNWQAQMVPMRTFDADGNGDVSAGVEAIVTAVSGGARVVNLSFSGSEFSDAEYDAINAAPTTLFVASAGNRGLNVDRAPAYPCAYDLPNVLCVTASGYGDSLPTWASFGAHAVDIAAPGVDIYSTLPNRSWGFRSGVSMAVPHVTGAAALLLTERPGAYPADLVAALLDSATPAPAFTGRTVSSGRLDVAGAMRALEENKTPSGPRPEPTPVVTPTPTPTATPSPQERSPSDQPTKPTERFDAGAGEPAKLKVRRASVKHGLLDVTAEITRRATGTVGVSFTAKGRTTRVRARIGEGGKIHFVYQLPKAGLVDGGLLTLTWEGSRTVRPATVRLRAADRPAGLRRGAISLRAGVMTVAGTISPTARGVVRLQLEYVDAGQVRTATYAARIVNGRWTLTSPVPAAARTGGYLTIQYTGLADAPGGPLRGEQDAKQLTGG
jgi:hypothetical protein